MRIKKKSMYFYQSAEWDFLYAEIIDCPVDDDKWLVIESGDYRNGYRAQDLVLISKDKADLIRLGR